MPLTETQDQIDARRYRGFRDALINQDESFMEVLVSAFPEGSEDDEDFNPTSEMVDAGIDLAIAAAEAAATAG